MRITDVTPCLVHAPCVESETRQAQDLAMLLHNARASRPHSDARKEKHEQQSLCQVWSQQHDSTGKRHRSLVGRRYRCSRRQGSPRGGPKQRQSAEQTSALTASSLRDQREGPCSSLGRLAHSGGRRAGAIQALATCQSMVMFPSPMHARHEHAQLWALAFLLVPAQHRRCVVFAVIAKPMSSAECSRPLRD